MIRKEPTPEKIRVMIDSIKDREDEEEMGKLYEIIGIGQTIKAINHHLGKLEWCWLLHTGKSSVSMGLVEDFVKTFGGGTVKVKPVEIEDINKIGEVSKVVDDIYRNGLEERGLVQSDVIVDVTGGTPRWWVQHLRLPVHRKTGTWSTWNRIPVS